MQQPDRQDLQAQQHQHHHHHQQQQQQQPHHHHHHCHHRSHKKRLFLESSDDKNLTQKSDARQQQEQRSRESAKNQSEDLFTSNTDEQNVAKPQSFQSDAFGASKAEPLQEINTQTNVSSSTNHERDHHHCDKSRSSAHPHHHHHHHHHHRPHHHHGHQQRQDQSCEISTSDRQLTSKVQHFCHHRHHRHHHHHCHHRNHKRRLIQESNVVRQADLTGLREAKGAGDLTAANVGGGQLQTESEFLEKSKSESNPEAAEVSKDAPSQSNSTLCSNREHARSKQHSLQSGHPHPHNHPHHHHHHHHHHHRQDSNKDISNSDRQLTDKNYQHCQHRHHRHHHHHHHHHHHGHKQRNRSRQKSSSKSNLEESSKGINQENKAPAGAHVEGSGSLDAEHEAATSNDQRGADAAGCVAENKMHLDHDGTGKTCEIDATKTKAKVNADGCDRETVVNMEMSPNNAECKSIRMIEDCEQMVESTTSDQNLITSIEIVPIDLKMQNEQAIDRAQSCMQSEQTNRVEIQKNQSSKAPSKRESISGKNREHEKQGIRSTKEDMNRREDQLVDRISSQCSLKKSQNDPECELLASNRDETDRDDLKKAEISASDCAPFQTTTPGSQSSQPKQIIQSSVPTDRRCRLCWCCCCPCSALSNKTGTSRNEVVKPSSEPSESQVNRYPSLPNVPLEEIRTWAESFDRLMKCSDGRKVFQDFLRCEYSEENILFWSACEELKSERDSKSVAAKARDIYEDYISILSSKEVSLDSRVRDVINNNIKKPTSNIFDEAQLQIYTLMHRDSYPRFINSPLYKKLAQLPTSSRKSSS